MTGIERLREKLYELGANKAQVESRVVELTIVALAGEESDNSKQLLQLVDDIKLEYKAQSEKAKQEIRKLQHSNDEILHERARIVSKRDIVNKAHDDLNVIVDRLLAINEEISVPETAEFRDKLRLAKFLQDNTQINTCYDNTAYINALGKILSCTEEMNTHDIPNPRYTKQERNLNTSKTESIKRRLSDIKEMLHNEWYSVRRL